MRRTRRREKAATMVSGLDRGGHGRWEASILEAAIGEDEDWRGDNALFLFVFLDMAVAGSLKRVGSSLFIPSNFGIV